MSLSEEERNVLVSLQLEKSKRDLAQGDKMLEIEYFNLAANRYYYACFHAIQALLIKNRHNCHTHSGTISTFGLNFVKTGLIDTKYGQFVSRLEDMREKADYNCFYEITEDEARRLKSPAHDFYEIIKLLLEE